MSDDVAIRFTGVSKTYRVGTVVAVGLKNVVLHLPKVIARWRRRQPFHALDDVSFEVKRGESIGIIGPNGSGKSTTLGLIARVLKPSAGKIESFGRICPLLELGAGFHPELNGAENVHLNGVLLGLRRQTVRERFDAIVEFSELGEFIHRPIRTYSSGMLARLGFAVAVHLDPEILLVDEALAVGDESFRQKCHAKLTEFRERGVTIVIVTHELDRVAELCDRVALLDHGRIVSFGEPRSVIDEYRATLAPVSGT